MSDTNSNPAGEAGRDRAAELASKRVAELQELAASLRIRGAARMRKSALVDALVAAEQGGAPASPEGAAAQAEPQQPAEPQRPKRSRAKRGGKREGKDATAGSTPAAPASSGEQPAEPTASESQSAEPAREQNPQAAPEQREERRRGRQPARGRKTRDQERSGAEGQAENAPLTLDDIVLPPARDLDQDEVEDEPQEEEQQPQPRRRSRNRNRTRGGEGGNGKHDHGEEGTEKRQRHEESRDDESHGSKQGRGRERKRGRTREDADPEIAPDDVLLPIAGILDVLDNYAFVRTSGYLADSNDVYVSLGQVKKYGLRKGDAIVGAIRQPREGEHQSGRQKYNALVKIDTINGQTPEESGERAEFDSLVPLYPTRRLTLEAPGGHATQRLIDLFAPIGLGARGLIVAPPKSGKSIALERIANAIARNSPETHLMLVLVDERPEEVTRLQRTIHGEVVASTFDMPAENHTTIAELAIERAKRLVELGLDVVVLLDSITQLCRAYNLTAPASGRIISGGVDASALYPPKRFFGAARKIENGGSLTILATAMVETGSPTDEVILEEFAGTGNMELRLSREIADKRIFPAIDIQNSSTLHEEQLLGPDELEVTWAIRRALDGDKQHALESVLARVTDTPSNAEFVRSVKSNPIRIASTRR